MYTRGSEHLQKSGVKLLVYKLDFTVNQGVVNNGFIVVASLV
jgi:hypothetical protein